MTTLSGNAPLGQSRRVDLAFWLAKKRLRRRQAARGSGGLIKSWEQHNDWRMRELQGQFDAYFGAATVRGKDVLDFACGDGALSLVIAEAGAARVHGVDINAISLARFAERLKGYHGSPVPSFAHGTTASSIDGADRSFDMIFCFDALEHVAAYRSIIPEWHRLLRSGGRVCIWWQPYWHPYGHHCDPWAPIPWMHAWLDDAELNELCARVVDWPEFDPPLWDLNPDGTRKNRFRTAPPDDDYLNKLTIAEFERTSRAAGFEIARRELHAFSGSGPVRAISGMMTRIPLARDFFTAFAIYEIAARK